MKINPNLRVFITGKTQSGKSYLAKTIIKNLNNRLIYDVKREYSQLGAVVNNLEQLHSAVKSGVTKLVYQPINFSVDHFDSVCNYVVTYLKNIMFCVDEVHLFCPKHLISSEFKRMITTCQSDPYNIGVICITQRPANVHNDVISQSSIVICFKLNLQHDAKFVSMFTGIDETEIRNIKYRHFYVYNDREDQSIQLFKPI